MRLGDCEVGGWVEVGGEGVDRRGGMKGGGKWEWGEE